MAQQIANQQIRVQKQLRVKTQVRAGIYDNGKSIRDMARMSGR